VDYVLPVDNFSDRILDKPNPIMGGTAFNAAKSFKLKGFEPIIFGKIGDDHDGKFVQIELEKNNLTSFVGISEENKPTGNCYVIYIDGNKKRWLIKEEHNANDYDITLLEQTLQLTQIGKGNFVFLIGHFFVRLPHEKIKTLFDRLAKTEATIILDIVPHNMYEHVKLAEFQDAIGNTVNVIISEFNTLQKLIGRTAINDIPDDNDWEDLLTHFPVKMLVVRYGESNIARQAICLRVGKNGFNILENGETGYSEATLQQKKGFGDYLTANVMAKYADKIR
jgi:sugar/nucleoside kinase (ribokinase family)